MTSPVKDGSARISNILTSFSAVGRSGFHVLDEPGQSQALVRWLQLEPQTLSFTLALQKPMGDVTVSLSTVVETAD